MNFFILSGGLGTRARPLSNYLPKPLFPLNGTPIIEILLQQFQEANLHKGFINLHYKGDLIRKTLQKHSPIYIEEPILSGSSILKKALPLMDGEWIFIMNGDVFMNIPINLMVSDIKNKTNQCDGILLTRPNEKGGYPSLVFEKNVFRRREQNSPAGSSMYTGAAILHRRVIESIDTFNFFETLEQNKFKIHQLSYTDTWLDLGSPASYYRGERVYSDKSEENSCSAKSFISETSKVFASILWPDCKIEGNSIISHSIITSGTEVKDCIASDAIITTEGIYTI